MEVTGILVEIFDEVQISEKFRKRDIVVRVDHNTAYPQDVCFQLTQTRTDICDSIPKGVEVIVSFNLRGRRYEKDGKVSYFNTLDCWKIQSTQPVVKQQQQRKENQTPTQNTQEFRPDIHTYTANPDDDLPF